MGKFVLGAVVALLAVAVATYLYLRLGFLDFRADARPSNLESQQAMTFLDASVDRRAPDAAARKFNEQELLEGVKLYKTHCAECHGSPDRKEQNLASLPFYPPAPQFMEDAPDMAENENFYIIQHGVRWTGMPAWGKTLTTGQMWELADFLGHMENLPPAAQQEWGAPAKSSMPGMDMKRKK